MHKLSRTIRVSSRLFMSKSSTSAALKHFFVYAPDTEGSIDLRYQVRATHLDNIKPLIEAGVVQVGGMIVQTETDVGSPRPQAAGSHLMIKAQSLEEARTIIETDIYYTSGVWDRERIVILPFISATPFPQ